MIKLEFPADRPDIARALSVALLSIAEAPKTLEEVMTKPPAWDTEHYTKTEGDDPVPQDPPAGEPLSDTRVDENGVAFNAAFCGNAAEPFYPKGDRAGQWKKRKGVEWADYDGWYKEQSQPPGSPSTLREAPPPPPVNVGSAFGSSPAPQPPPADAGSLMVWISEKQAAGLLTQDDLNAAYRNTGVSTADLFGANAAPHISAIYNYLQPQV